MNGNVNGLYGGIVDQSLSGIDNGIGYGIASGLYVDTNIGSIIGNRLVLNLDASSRLSYIGTGTLWNDLSGRRNNGILTNGAIFDTVNGDSILFDGSNDRVSINTSTSLDIQSTITLEILMRPNINNQNGGVLGKWTTGAGSDNSYLFFLGQDVNNNRYGFSIYQSNNSLRSLFPTTTFNANQWYHIVCVANGSIMNIYNNGVIDSSSLSYDGTIKTSTKNVMVGTLRQEDNLYPFNGRIALAKIYNRALSQSEINFNYTILKTKYQLT